MPKLKAFHIREKKIWKEILLKEPTPAVDKKEPTETIEKLKAEKDYLLRWYRFMTRKWKYKKIKKNLNDEPEKYVEHYLDEAIDYANSLKVRYRVIIFITAIIPLISTAMLLFLPAANKEIENMVSFGNILILIVSIAYNTFSLKKHNQWNLFSLVIMNYIDGHKTPYTKKEYDKIKDVIKKIALGAYTSFEAFRTGQT